MTLPIYQSFIDGRFQSGHGEIFNVINPATGEVIYQVEQANQALFEQAVESSGRAFVKWSALAGLERGRILRRASRPVTST